MTSKEKCIKCADSGGGVADWVGCKCGSWSHKKCAGLSGVKNDALPAINWVCDECYTGVESLPKLITENKRLRRELDNLHSVLNNLTGDIDAIKMAMSVNTKQLLNEIKNNAEMVKREISDEIVDNMNSLKIDIIRDLKNDLKVASVPMQSYASAVKKNEKKKNLLIIEADDVVSKKDAISSAMKGSKPVNTKFADKKVIVNFDSSKDRDSAAEKIQEIEHLKVKSGVKLFPKIMIKFAHKLEMKDTVVNHLIERNDYLTHVPDIRNKLTLIKEIEMGDAKHFVVKCNPDVRELIHKNNDEVFLEWGRYRVCDSYHVIACYFCQKYGHIEANCTSKENGGKRLCGRCMGEHPTKGCTSATLKCANCVRFKKVETEHRVNDKCCQVLKEETERVKSKTENGY